MRTTQHTKILHVSRFNFHESTHFLKAGCGWCTCGISWQESYWLCHHACNYFFGWKGIGTSHHYELNKIFSAHALNELYTTNIMCVVVDSVSYDGQTHHHPVVHSQRISGMPEVKQIYQRIELLDVKNVPISCSIC